MRALIGKRAYLTVAFAVPFVLAMTEPALAHTLNIAGTMVLTGNAGGTTTTVAYGGTSACTTSSGGAQATSSGGSVGITVSPSPANGSCSAINKLPGGHYNVFYVNNAASTTDSPIFRCIHDWAVNPTPSLGTMQISQSGSGSGTYSLPNGLAVTPTNGATICITDEAKEVGTQNPVNGLYAMLTIVP